MQFVGRISIKLPYSAKGLSEGNMKEKLYDLKQKHLKKHISQTQFIAYGFFLIIMTGTLLLMLPV